MRYLVHVTPRPPSLLLLLVVMMCCAGGCFAASLTYSCFSDNVMRADRANSISAVVRDVPFGAEGTSQAHTVIERNGWASIRTNLSTRDLDDTRKYCLSRRSHGKVWRTKKATTKATPTAGLVEVTAASEPRRWGTLVPALLQKSHVGMVLRQSSSKGNPEW
ncbi:surface protease GP63 [Trypanosoma cruzi]|nr:surface protease GP63 [Trypanosoma cruzi]